MSAAHWSINVRCSLANWCQLLIGQLMSAAHWPTDVSFSLAKWYMLLIGQLMSASRWPTDDSYSLPTYVNCSLANGYMLLIGQLISLFTLFWFENLGLEAQSIRPSRLLILFRAWLRSNTTCSRSNVMSGCEVVCLWGSEHHIMMSNVMVRLV